MDMKEIFSKSTFICCIDASLKYNALFLSYSHNIISINSCYNAHVDVLNSWYVLVNNSAIIMIYCCYAYFKLEKD